MDDFGEHAVPVRILLYDSAQGVGIYGIDSCWVKSESLFKVFFLNGFTFGLLEESAYLYGDWVMIIRNAKLLRW